MSSILITGAAGFIGSQLAYKLWSDGEKITLIDNFSYGSEDNLIFDRHDFRDEIHRKDIRDTEYLNTLFNTNKFEEPTYHENSRLGRKGMSLINSKYEPTFIDYEYSDHQLMSFEIDYNITGYNKQIDVPKVPQRLIAAGFSGIYKIPYKIH